MAKKDEQEAVVEEAVQEPELQELLPNVIVVFGEQRVLKPLVGRKSRMMFPSLIGLLGKILSACIAADIDLAGIFSGKAGQAPGDNKEDIIVLMLTLSQQLAGPVWEQFEVQILPFLLQEPNPERLEDEGDPFEIYWSAYRAMQFYVKTSLQKPQIKALGKLWSEATRRKNSPVPGAKAPAKT